MSTAAPAIECAGLVKVFKDFWLRARVTAVRDLDLTVRRGEVFGLLGPNGSGKSTTIKMILGLLHPTRGKLLCLGKHPSDVAVRHRLGYLPEDSYLYRFLDARELLDYYGRLFGLGRAERASRSAMLLEMVGLEGVQHRPIGEYSKGMLRRIGLAQALINDPDLLILDEPTAGMDPLGARQMKDLVIALKRRGKTILLCSHLLAEVEDVCDRVAILYGGRKRVEGAVSELLSSRDRLSIETPALPAEVLAEIEGLVARATGGKATVSGARQSLESLFLDIVAAAQAEGAATSGAAAGGPVAAFLASGGAAATDALPAADIVGALVSADRAARPPAPAPAPSPRPEPAVDAAVLGGLIEPTARPSAPVAPPADPAAPAKRASEAVDAGVIDSLLEDR